MTVTYPWSAADWAFLRKIEIRKLKMKNLKKDEENIEELETVKKLYEKLLDYENYDRSVFMKTIIILKLENFLIFAYNENRKLMNSP